VIRFRLVHKTLNPRTWLEWDLELESEEFRNRWWLANVGPDYIGYTGIGVQV